MLAYRIYPLPNGTEYTEAELHDPRIVETLFDYCQILEAIITADGWRVLFEVHGADGLVAVNRKSGWFTESPDDDALTEIVGAAREAGYDPVSGGGTFPKGWSR